MKTEIDEGRKLAKIEMTDEDMMNLDTWLRDVVCSEIAGQMQNWNPNWNSPKTGNATALQVSTKICDKIEQRFWDLPPATPEQATQYRDELLRIGTDDINARYEQELTSYREKIKAGVKPDKYERQIIETELRRSKEIAALRDEIMKRTEGDAYRKLPPKHQGKDTGKITFSTPFDRLKHGVKKFLGTVIGTQ